MTLPATGHPKLVVAVASGALFSFDEKSRGS